MGRREKSVVEPDDTDPTSPGKRMYSSPAIGTLPETATPGSWSPRRVHPVHTTRHIWLLTALLATAGCSGDAPTTPEAVEAVRPRGPPRPPVEPPSPPPPLAAVRGVLERDDGNPTSAFGRYYRGRSTDTCTPRNCWELPVVLGNDTVYTDSVGAFAFDSISDGTHLIHVADITLRLSTRIRDGHTHVFCQTGPSDPPGCDSWVYPGARWSGWQFDSLEIRAMRGDTLRPVIPIRFMGGISIYVRLDRNSCLTFGGECERHMNLLSPVEGAVIQLARGDTIAGPFSEFVTDRYGEIYIHWEPDDLSPWFIRLTDAGNASCLKNWSGEFLPDPGRTFSLNVYGCTPADAPTNPVNAGHRFPLLERVGVHDAGHGFTEDEEVVAIGEAPLRPF